MSTLKIEWGGLHTVISGGQTGADQGGLIGAHRCNVKTGGTAPEMYRTDSGFNPLLECLGLEARGTYATRTRENIDASDGTVMVVYNPISPGATLTRRIARENKKPFLELNVKETLDLCLGSPEFTPDGVFQALAKHVTALVYFIEENQISVLNVAGNREVPGRNTLSTTGLMTSFTAHIVEIALEAIDTTGGLIRK